MGQPHHLAVGLVGSQNPASHPADILCEAHDQLLSYRVDGGVCHLGELLAEIVEEGLGLLAEHRQRCVVTHGCGRLLPVDGHGNDGGGYVFLSESEQQLFLYEVCHAVFHVTSRLQFFELDAVGGEPFPVGMLGCQLFLDFSVVIDFSLLCVDEQDLAWLEASFLGNLGRFEVHDSHLARHDHRVVFRDGVTGGSQTVAVEHASGETSVAEEQCCRAVPGLHQDGVILIKCLEVLADGVFVVERLWHEHRHGMGQRQAGHHEEFQHVVQTGRVAHAGLHDRGNLLHVAQCLARQHALSCLHPSSVAAYGVDLAVVAKEAEGLCQTPGREGVGAET